jgi:RNA polymerase-binding protein DksA
MRYDNLRASLVLRRREVMARYHGTLRRADEELAALDSEEVERATEQWDARVLSELGHADMRELVAVTEAIQRIDDGSYGTCADCGSEITERRLHALPAAQTCIRCATAAEPHASH